MVPLPATHKELERRGRCKGVDEKANFDFSNIVLDLHRGEFPRNG
jgi:hypothetical protein